MKTIALLHPRLFLLPLAVVSVLTMVGCVSTDNSPTSVLQAAEMAIKNADQARVADHASLELSEAREKLAAARAAVERRKPKDALRLAEEARIDAELAIVKAEQAKSQDINDEMQKHIDALKQEMQRNSGAKT